MSNNRFTPGFESLPDVLPLFPLSEAIVMPGCHLPLNIFEPRYIEMTLDSLKTHRLIGMIQPEPDRPEEAPLYRIGTAGRIVSFNELPDGRLLTVLLGVSRFDLRQEIAVTTSYRQAEVDWQRFRSDLEAAGEQQGYDRSRLMSLLKTYFDRKGLQTDWSALEQVPVPQLVNLMASQLPLANAEKQVLVEAVTPEERVFRFMHLLEFDVTHSLNGASTRH
ncbi:LON peptidase substrate-binding domain-containing protein [Methyloparacoccus murrellii]|jgi:Lon protease-like protein